jgi:lipoprotein signal peptidase
VVDFVDLGIGDLRWYTFNVADAAISCAILLLLLSAFVADRGGRAGSANGSRPIGRTDG